MKYDCKKMDMYRIATDSTDVNNVARIIREVLELKPGYSEEAGYTKLHGNIETMPVDEQIEAVMEMHDGHVPDMFQVWFSVSSAKTVKMETAWFRIVKKRKK